MICLGALLFTLYPPNVNYTKVKVLAEDANKREDSIYDNRMLLGPIVCSFGYFLKVEIHAYCSNLDLGGKHPVGNFYLYAMAASLMGSGLRYVSMMTLREFFTFKITHFADHRLIKTGPYEVLMHPSYIGLALGIGGYMCQTHIDPAIIILYLSYVILALLCRAYKEEVFLCDIMKEEYASYQRGKLCLYTCPYE